MRDPMSLRHSICVDCHILCALFGVGKNRFRVCFFGSVLQCVAVCCSVLQCVLQHVAVCCSVLQCVAVGCWCVIHLIFPSLFIEVMSPLRMTHSYGYMTHSEMSLQLGEDSFSSLFPAGSHFQKSARHQIYISRTLQHTATHCNTPQHTSTHCNTLQHTATK